MMKNRLKKNLDHSKGQVLAAAVLLILGIIIGRLIFGGEPVSKTPASATASEGELGKHIIWTCSMHPQIRQDHPGNCPICGMELIALNGVGQGSASAVDEIQMSESAMQIANVQTSVVKKDTPYKEVYLPGKVKADERLISVITSRFSGRIEKLFVSFTGQEVRKGEKLATIYSPDLITAQKELFEAKKYEKTNPSLFHAAVNKLKLWDLTEGQINDILENGEPRFYFDVLAPSSGTVTDRLVTLGDYLKEGSELFRIADLNKVWIVFDAYEVDMPWIKLGDKINFTVTSLPGRVFTSKVSFIDPVVNPSTRAVSVRTEISNTEAGLKPEMLVKGMLKASLPGGSRSLIIPKTAVLWTGKRAVVYVRKAGSDHIFSYREIELGPQAADFYVVESGLSEGDEIASNGVFKIDAAAQLQSKRSMMNPEGGADAEIGDHLAPAHISSEALNQQAIRETLLPLFNNYLSLKNALVDDDFEKSKEIAKLLTTQLKGVDMETFAGQSHEEWMQRSAEIAKALQVMEDATTIGYLRRQFKLISDQFIMLAVTFGPFEKELFIQHCPMANDRLGADWISGEEKILNPYFGHSMIGCGSVTKTIRQ